MINVLKDAVDLSGVCAKVPVDTQRKRTTTVHFMKQAYLKIEGTVLVFILKTDKYPIFHSCFNTFEIRMNFIINAMSQFNLQCFFFFS